MLILKNSRPDFKSLFKEHLDKVLSSYYSYNPYCYGYKGNLYRQAVKKVFPPAAEKSWQNERNNRGNNRGLKGC